MLAHIVQHWHPLARTTRTHVLQIEFTTRCDLKCTYCAVSQPNWPGKDLDLTRFNYQDLIDAARNRQCQVLNLHGHGETTMLPGWVNYATRAVDTGIPVTICSNFAHPHSPAETAILSRFHGITVSIDTVDPILYKRLRRGGKLQTLLDNMAKLRDTGSRARLTWCCVLTDQNWYGVPDLVRAGLELGVTTFCICNLNILPTPKGGTELKHVSTLDHDDAREARAMLEECSRLCVDRADFHLKSGLIDTLNGRLNG